MRETYANRTGPRTCAVKFPELTANIYIYYIYILYIYYIYIIYIYTYDIYIVYIIYMVQNNDEVEHCRTFWCGFPSVSSGSAVDPDPMARLSRRWMPSIAKWIVKGLTLLESQGNHGAAAEGGGNPCKNLKNLMVHRYFPYLKHCKTMVYHNFNQFSRSDCLFHGLSSWFEFKWLRWMATTQDTSDMESPVETTEVRLRDCCNLSVTDSAEPVDAWAIGMLNHVHL